MTKNQALQKITLFALLVSAVPFCGLAQAQVPVTVKAHTVDLGETIEYHYAVTNLTKTRSIMLVSIGNRGNQSNDPATDINEQPELSVYPTGSAWTAPGTVGDDTGLIHRYGGTFTSPPGWRAGTSGYGWGGVPRRAQKFSVYWGNETGSSLKPGQTFNFSVTVPKRSVTEQHPNNKGVVPDAFVPESFPMGDPAYLNGHFTVGFNANMFTKEGSIFWDYTGQIENLDTPPSP